MMQKGVSPLEKRLQYLRVQVIHRQVVKPCLASKYGMQALQSLFPDAQSVQFLLCEWGKTMSVDHGRTWYIRDPSERQAIEQEAAGRGLKAFTFY